jgi:hypothetical protein
VELDRAVTVVHRSDYLATGEPQGGVEASSMISSLGESSCEQLHADHHRPNDDSPIDAAVDARPCPYQPGGTTSAPGATPLLLRCILGMASDAASTN